MDNFSNDPDCRRNGKLTFMVPDLEMARQDVSLDLLKVLERGKNLEGKHMIPAKAGARRGVGHWMAGESPAMERLRQIIIEVADTGADVLIMGETGTGKELVARSLHDQSRRWKNKFVAINCCALPEFIMESELFGHEAGAFTGADRCRIGKFEFSSGGTLFLDEIDSMPVHLQAKLLRVLQERAVERVGSNEIIPLDIRVVASTKLDLKEACAQGKFREDLFYRLNVVNITLAPLRERREDIPLLFRYFALQAGSRYQRPVLELPEDLIEDILSRPWRGNVRELKNAAERYVLGFLADGENLASRSPKLENLGTERERREGNTSLSKQVQAFEKTLIAEALIRYRGDIKATHTALGLPRKTFYDKMRKYGLRRKDYLKQCQTQSAFPAENPDGQAIVH